MRRTWSTILILAAASLVLCLAMFAVRDELQGVLYRRVSLDRLLRAPEEALIEGLDGQRVVVSGYAFSSPWSRTNYRLRSDLAGPPSRPFDVSLPTGEQPPAGRQYVSVSGVLHVQRSPTSGDIYYTLTADPAGTETEPLWARGVGYGAAALPMLAPVLGLLLGICTVWMRHRRSRGFIPRLCPVCGYDLRATPDRCPECGTPSPALAGGTGGKLA